MELPKTSDDLNDGLSGKTPKTDSKSFWVDDPTTGKPVEVVPASFSRELECALFAVRVLGKTNE